MRIVIVGAGKVGAVLCSDLSREGHEITLIEQKEDRLQNMMEQFEILGVQGNGAFYDVQMEAAVDKADMFISVTPMDEVNIISCVIAKKLGAQHAIARVRTPEHAAHMGFVRDNLGITRMINPDLEAAQEIYRMIRYPSALSVEPFAGNRINLVELLVTPDAVLHGMDLAGLRRKFQSLLVCMVVRGDETIIPKGDTRLMDGDRVFIIGKPQDMGTLYRQMGTVDRIRSVLIVGGGRICRYLLELLREWKLDIKVIESNPDTAEDMAVAFPEVSVIHGDGTDQGMLDTENIQGYDCVVSLTGIDEENILVSMFAASRKVPRNITKVNRTNLLDMLKGMGLQSVITPADIVTTNILRVVRAISNSEGSKVEALYRLKGSSAEVMLFRLPDNPGLVGKPIRELDLKPGTLIAAILHGQQLTIPTGSDVMQAGQHVLVVSSKGAWDDIEEILE
jgi:trk system potassium uptake protein TrkA